MKTNTENSLENLKKALPIFEAVDDWRTDTLIDTISKFVEAEGIKNGQILWPMRTALSGKASTPGGAYELAEILGKEESLRRIRIGIEKLSSELN